MIVAAFKYGRNKVELELKGIGLTLFSTKIKINCSIHMHLFKKLGERVAASNSKVIATYPLASVSTP